MATPAGPGAVFQESPWKWFRSFLTQELSPYPGRGWVVARMTIAATLMMLWIMTFRIPGAALGAYYTLLFARDTPEATVKSATTTLLAVGASVIFVLVGAALLAGEPFLHFLWVSGTLLVTFFLISSLSEYRAGTAFGFLAVSAVTSWDFPANTELRVEGTLWSALAVGTAACVTVAIELISQRIHPFSQFAQQLDDRLNYVEELLSCLGENKPISERARKMLDQYAMTGTASLRRFLARSDQNPHYVAEMSAVVALAGRLVDISANAFSLPPSIRNEGSARFAQAARNLHAIRTLLRSGNPHQLAEIQISADLGVVPSFIGDVENTIVQIPQVFAGDRSFSAFLPSRLDARRSRSLFKDDAFTNPAHIQFALKGTLAAVSCYVIYNSIQWPGLSTAVATCMITALSNVGSSRQKQILRVSGALIGGVGLAITAQVFLLPHMDGISEFTVLFVAVTLAASWIATSSPRLSYAGVQIAFAFYVTHLRGFGPQTSLALARDDVMGIMFGLLAMWVLFDQLWAKDALHEMIDTFTANMRRIAAYGKQVITPDLRSAVNRVRAERDLITNNFDQIRNQSDAVIFEFGAGWTRKVALRNKVRAWQPLLRTYFLLQIAVAQYRIQLPERFFDSETEGNLQRGESLLEALADFLDAERSNGKDVPSRRVSGFITDSQAQLTNCRTEPLGNRGNSFTLSCTMLEIAVSLARQMLEP